MTWLRHAFWWSVSVAALLAGAFNLWVVLRKPWLSLIYVVVALAVLAALISNPLVRPRIGLGRRPIVTLGILALLTAVALSMMIPIYDQALVNSGALPTSEQKAAVEIYNRGVALLEDENGEPDKSAALALFHEACSLDVAKACYNYAVLIGDEANESYDISKARLAYQETCQTHQYQQACGNLAVLMEQGLGGDVDKAGAYELYVVACNGNVDVACRNMTNVGQEIRASGALREAGPAIATARTFCEAGASQDICDFADLEFVSSDNRR